MPSRFFWRYLPLLSAALAACAPATPSVSTPPTAERAAVEAPATAALAPEIEARLDSIGRALVARSNVPRLIVAVARGDEVVFARGYGMANREQGVEATPEAVFRISSMMPARRVQ